MKDARIFDENMNPIPVSAEEVLMGKYDRELEFVDIEYEFKVTFVKAARNGGGPYFRMYYSLEDYSKKYPDKAAWYEIVRKLRHERESKWHKEWKEKFDDFCDLEKCIKDTSINKWKFADVYYEEKKTVVELQHSFISFNFEERNAFYKKMSLETIWLYDLTAKETKLTDDGYIELLEDNSKGFFKISENENNLSDNRVYIQTKNKNIYRVTELKRRETSSGQKSTIRYFYPVEEYTEEEFVEAVRNGDLLSTQTPKPLGELWSEKYIWMRVIDIRQKELPVYIRHNGSGEMFRRFGIIQCSNHSPDYPISPEEEKEKIWLLDKYKLK